MNKKRIFVARRRIALVEHARECQDEPCHRCKRINFKTLELMTLDLRDAIELLEANGEEAAR